MISLFLIADKKKSKEWEKKSKTFRNPLSEIEFEKKLIRNLGTSERETQSSKAVAYANHVWRGKMRGKKKAAGLLDCNLGIPCIISYAILG